MNTALAVLLTASATWLCASFATPDDDLARLQQRVLQLEQKLSGDVAVSGLAVADRDGNVRLRFGTQGSAGEPFIVLFDQNGFARLDMRLDHGDAPYVAFRDQKSTRLRVEVPAEGAAGLGVWGKGPLGETSHFGLWIWEDQTIAFGGGLRSAGEGTFHLQTLPAGETSLVLRTASGVETFRAPKRQQ